MHAPVRPALWLGLLLALGGASENASAESKYIRFRHFGVQSGVLETSIVTYHHPETGLEVDLVGVVHIGDRPYYHQLQYLLDRYDTVLFERVEGNDNPTLGVIGRLQLGLQAVLGLRFQLEEIDYGRAHFVHADVTWRELSAEFRKQGLELGDVEAPEEIGSYLDSVIVEARRYARQNPAMTASLKISMASVLSDMEGLLAQLRSTPEGSSQDVLIAMRNERVLEKLEKLAGASKVRSVAIFYGAAHMPHFAHQLIHRFGFEERSRRWIRAWTIAPEGGISRVARF